MRQNISKKKRAAVQKLFKKGSISETKRQQASFDCHLEDKKWRACARFEP